MSEKKYLTKADRRAIVSARKFKKANEMSPEKNLKKALRNSR